MRQVCGLARARTMMRVCTRTDTHEPDWSLAYISRSSSSWSARIWFKIPVPHPLHGGCAGSQEMQSCVHMP
jgi:hypothetical protein